MNVLADAGYGEEGITPLHKKDLELFVANIGWNRPKVLAKRGPPMGRIPHETGPKGLMERNPHTKPGQKVYRKRARTLEPMFG